MDERTSKTIICSIFFLDIVEYSKKSVAGQISLKERFNAFLSKAIEAIPLEDRIILDTGDGAAVSFLGDVEDALRASLSMRASLLSDEGLKDPPLLVRMGINLGPVRLVKDINGQPNIVGDGINVAQRVMGFAEPGQILVSRSYYDAVSRLSPEYAGMFHYQGAKTDKHVREHEVYAIGYPGDLTREYQKIHAKWAEKLKLGLISFSKTIKAYTVAMHARIKSSIAEGGAAFKEGTPKQKAIYVGMMAIPVLILAVMIKLAFKHPVPPQLTSSQTVTTESGQSVAGSSVQQTGTHGKETPRTVVETTKSKLAHDSKSSADKVKDKKASVKDKKEIKAKNDVKPAQPGKEGGATHGATGVVLVTVKPWGEVYLDGKMIDVSPPLSKLTVPVGEHVIEIKNTTFPSYKQKIKITPGEKETVFHKFVN